MIHFFKKIINLQISNQKDRSEIHVSTSRYKLIYKDKLN